MSEEGYFKKPEMTKPPESMTRDGHGVGDGDDADARTTLCRLTFKLGQKK